MKLFENIVGLEKSKVEGYQKKADDIRVAIENKMDSFENFDSISISSGKDDDAIILSIHSINKKIKGYFFGKCVKVNMDNYTVEEVIDRFEKNWLEFDTPEKIKERNDFINLGNKFGWD